MAIDLKKWIIGGASFIALTIAGVWVLDVYGWLQDQTAPASPMKIDFQASQRCVSGELGDIARHFADRNVKLEWGADRLVICDSDTLKTNVVNAPEDIAKAFPGCLKYGGGALRMLRASAAVCAVDVENVYICDGDAAGVYPGSEGMGAQDSVVRTCSGPTLARFGFNH